MNDKNINSEVDQTLNVFLTSKRVDAPLFFTDKLMNKIQNMNREEKKRFMLRIKWAFATVVVLIGLNSVVFISQYTTKPEADNSRQELLKSFGEEYLLVDNEAY